MSQISEVVHHDGRLYHLGFTSDEIAGSVFLVGDPARAYKVAAHFDSIEHEIKRREFVTLTGIYEGVSMSVVGTGIGPDNMEIVLIELHAAHALDLETGAAKPESRPLDIIRVGTSGGIQPDLAVGTLCIAEYALGLDSTGFYYDSAPTDSIVVAIEQEAQRLIDEVVGSEARFHRHIRTYASKAHSKVHELLVAHAQRTGIRYASGITVSSPGFYGPSSRNIAGLRNTVPDIKGTLASLVIEGRKVLNMEMESSLLFHLAGALGHRAGTICPSISQPEEAADLIDHNAWIETAISVALNAMLELKGLPATGQK